MSRVCERILVCLSILLMSAPLFAQEWSAEQKEVLAFETAFWKAVADRDQTAALALMHEDYQGWSFGSLLPSGKASAKASFAHSFPATKTFYHEVTPLKILVKGNLAVVHYVLSGHGTNEKGEHESGDERWTDVLIQEGGRWLLLGDQGGSPSDFEN